MSFTKVLTSLGTGAAICFLVIGSVLFSFYDTMPSDSAVACQNTATIRVVQSARS